MASLSYMDAPKPFPSHIPSYAIDDVAMAALRARCEQAEGELSCCDLCGEPIVGQPAGSGLLLWARGDEIHCDEPPLCARCAAEISLAALAGWDGDDGDE